MQNLGLENCGFGSGWYQCGFSVKRQLQSEWDLAWESTLFLFEEDVSHFGEGMEEMCFYRREHLDNSRTWNTYSNLRLEL